MDPVKVVIADDHPLFREGLKRILSLERNILVAGEAERGDQIIPAVEATHADVLLLDLKMPGNDLIQTLLWLKERCPAARAIVLTAFPDGESILNAAKAGARGYATKEISGDTLLEAIKTVSNGGVWIDRGLPYSKDFAEIAEAQSNPDEPAEDENQRIRSLTRREVEILKLVAEGLSNEEIANRVFISERTVKTHLTNIFDKLKVNNRFKAALLILKSQG
jgi:two-component system response regulator DegU